MDFIQGCFTLSAFAWHLSSVINRYDWISGLTAASVAKGVLDQC
jgi:hypothetical protein